MTNKDFFYCYNKQLFIYLHDIKGIDYITVAINPMSKKTFSMFAKNDTLQQALDAYRNN